MPAPSPRRSASPMLRLQITRQLTILSASRFTPPAQRRPPALLEERRESGRSKGRETELVVCARGVGGHRSFGELTKLGRYSFDLPLHVRLPNNSSTY